MPMREVERALAEWRAAQRHLETVDPGTEDWTVAARAADAARTAYETLTRSRSGRPGPGAASREGVGAVHEGVEPAP